MWHWVNPQRLVGSKVKPNTLGFLSLRNQAAMRCTTFRDLHNHRKTVLGKLLVFLDLKFKR